MIRLFLSGSKKSKDKRDWDNCQCSCKFYGDSFIQSRRTKVVHGIPGGGSSGNGRGVIHSSSGKNTESFSACLGKTKNGAKHRKTSSGKHIENENDRN